MTGAGVGGGNRRVKVSPACRDPEDIMIINQIMLRFRPIAPRPVTVDGSIGPVPVKEKRAKRKYVRVKKKTVTKVKIMGEECNLANLTKDDGKGCMSLNLTHTDPVPVPVRVQKVSVPEWIRFDTDQINNIITTWTPSSKGLHEVDLATTVARPRYVESWITVESVIGACEEDDGRGWLMYTDEEILKDLETDRCPGFISNGEDEVQWVNPAYRRMVDPSGDGGAPPCEVVVRLGVKVEKGAFEHWLGFSCRVSVGYVLSEKKKKKKRMTVPCDVRKMNSGGYAWRLDVEAALSLGRLS